jgi:hypothetical protein
MLRRRLNTEQCVPDFLDPDEEVDGDDADADSTLFCSKISMTSWTCGLDRSDASDASARDRRQV